LLVGCVRKEKSFEHGLGTFQQGVRHQHSLCAQQSFQLSGKHIAARFNLYNSMKFSQPVRWLEHAELEFRPQFLVIYSLIFHKTSAKLALFSEIGTMSQAKSSFFHLKKERDNIKNEKKQG
jgi:hypothetical protein